MIYACTFVLAFCSIVYELLLGQTLSAFLGNTVLRYSVTIGLYMLSMGAGAFLVRERMLDRPVRALQRVELLLTGIGAVSVSLLFLLDAAGVPRFLFTASAHLLIVVIGVLTGLELPLLIELRRLEKEDTEGAVLGVDYFGAFAGTVAFAFWFYPRTGIVPTAFAVAALNAAVGVVLAARGRARDGGGRTGSHRGLLLAQGALLAALLCCLGWSAAINEYEVSLYLGG